MLTSLLLLMATADPHPAPPPLPEGVTSFGAAVAGDFVYTYGGHTGPSHSYSAVDQNGTLRRLSLSNPTAWEELPGGPKRQGLALVGHGGKVWRLGGFEALNPADTPHDLHSRADVAVFDPATKAWTDATPLPEPRSSFDAAVIGDRLYVVGGWALEGKSDSTWHDSAWSADLTRTPLAWERLPDPGFRRRALAVAGHGGKLYVLGGMTETDGPTRDVAVYDPATKVWSDSPALSGEKPLDGFGVAARDTPAGLFVTSLTGTAQRLADDGSRWEMVGQLDNPRFFHQMAPLAGGLLLIGGGNMSEGRFTELEFVPTGPAR